MLHPLLSLWRHSCRVTFYDQGVPGVPGSADDAPHGALAPLATKRWFRSNDEAAGYLRYWAGDPSAQAELRWLLKKCSPGPVAGQSADRWIQALAALLLSGVVVAVEETSRRALPSRLAPAPSSSAAAAAAALAALPPIEAMPSIPAPENLLPALEDVRIEGAEVLPELDQSLAQVTATIGEVDSASLSVEPAPSQVPGITDAMGAAAANAQQAIDGG